MLEARLVVTDEGRALADLIGVDNLCRTSREVGWELLITPHDARAELVVFGVTSWPRSEDPEVRLPHFWVAPHARYHDTSGDIDPKALNWRASPSPAGEPDDHGWFDQRYDAAEIPGWVRGWLYATRLRRRLRIFVSYAREDLRYAREVADGLAENGHDVWLDERCLLPGQDWALEIRRAIRKADAVVVLISARSVDKVGYVQKEIRLMLDAADLRPEHAIFMVPMRIDEAPIPDRLSHLQYVDLQTSEWLRRLEASLSLVRGHSGP